MKKGFALIELISVLVILSIIGLVVTVIVVGIIKDIKNDSDKIVIKNYANSVAYAFELYAKNNDNKYPTWCIIKDDVIFVDENNNQSHDKSEPTCDKDCESSDCVKNYITYNDIDNANDKVKCNKVTLKDRTLKISGCTVSGRELKNYSYKISLSS